jgi:predicted HAD superfamily Cof-like phosphohydrolase
MTPIPDSAGVAGATNTPNPNQDAPEGVQALRGETSGSSSWAAVEALAALMEPDAFGEAKWANPDMREAYRQKALGHAATVITRSDYRRVVEDDDAIAGMVREFHVAFDLPINDATRTLNKLRADLIREEAAETAEAVESGDLEHMAKELADLAYVAYGAALTLGIDLDVAIAAVHASNMSKLVDGKPVMREDGKVLKGPNYAPPDMSRAVVRALREET